MSPSTASVDTPGKAAAAHLMSAAGVTDDLAASPATAVDSAAAVSSNAAVTRAKRDFMSYLLGVGKNDSAVAGYQAAAYHLVGRDGKGRIDVVFSNSHGRQARYQDRRPHP